MNLKDQNNPAVLNAIKEIMIKSREDAADEKQKVSEAAASKYTNFTKTNPYKGVLSEALVGKQKNIDKNKNGKIDAHDFQLLKGKKEVEEGTDTPGNSYEHQCAIHVKHEKLGEGKTLSSQHAEPDENGNIAWYDVMFAEGIEKQVPVTELEVLVSESHGNHKKKK